ncbi:P cell-type agglutination protein map4-like [Haliotis rubra]|uniref:P cell-type agglutination protein map4-like n=1 Tax=Haliotis rubra TaxID=36100 RepID=UPI001EE50D91|nr:P cell-type agglutination protein map4-like [Haliotis rubra]
MPLEIAKGFSCNGVSSIDEITMNLGHESTMSEDPSSDDVDSTNLRLCFDEPEGRGKAMVHTAERIVEQTSGLHAGNGGLQYFIRKPVKVPLYLQQERWRSFPDPIHLVTAHYRVSNVLLRINDISILWKGCQTSLELLPFTQRFRDIPDAASPNLRYSWNPCEPFSEGSVCQGVELCQLSPTTGDDYVLGRGGNSRFVVESLQRIFFVYSILSDQGQTRETYIELVCNASVDAQLVFQEENPPLTYHMVLTSKYACPHTVPSNSTVSPTTSTASTTASSTTTTPISTASSTTTTPSSTASSTTTTLSSTVPPATRTTVTPPFPTPTSPPRPNIFNLETITILLGCIFLSLLFLIFLVFIGLITRR